MYILRPDEMTSLVMLYTMHSGVRGEADRKMETVDLLVGTFVIKGQIRISTHSEVDNTLETARVSWMSVYDVSITNPYLPQMPALQVPMLLVNPSHVAFGLG